jgi:hypothetical protein
MLRTICADAANRQLIKIFCYWNATEIDPSLNDRANTTAPFIIRRILNWIRTATSGSSESYDGRNDTTETIRFVTPTYPNGGNGAYLAEENGK